MIVMFDEVCILFHFNDMIYLLTAIGLTPGGSSTVHIYTQTIHRTIINNSGWKTFWDSSPELSN